MRKDLILFLKNELLFVGIGGLLAYFLLSGDVVRFAAWVSNHWENAISGLPDVVKGIATVVVWLGGFIIFCLALVKLDELYKKKEAK